MDKKFWIAIGILVLALIAGCLHDFYLVAK